MGDIKGDTRSLDYGSHRDMWGSGLKGLGRVRRKWRIDWIAEWKMNWNLRCSGIWRSSPSNWVCKGIR